MNNVRQYIVVSIILLVQILYSQSADNNCYAILVGKNATEDGSVLFAHNEDDYGVNLVNWYKVPALNHEENEAIELFTGGELSQASSTNEFLWLEMPGMHFSDSYMNEYGVTIASDACRSKEDSAELVDGGIGYHLRRIMAEQAKSAKEAVKIAGAIVDSIGYASSGRTYSIADPKEAWMMSVVKGKHWVAQRVPEDHIAIIPNYYTIAQIDLADTLNFLGSEDIINYAIERGWFDPEAEDEFIFREVYGDSASQNNIRNIARHWGAFNLLMPDEYDLYDEFPFSFKPTEKVSIQDLMDILEYHYEYTMLEDKNINSPHDYKTLPICRKDTQYGMIAQLRNWLPSDIGNVLWLAPHRPCSQVFVPWYYGISEIPINFYKGDYNSALANHFIKRDDIKSMTKTHNFWLYVDFANSINSSYYDLMPDVIKRKNIVQKQIFDKFEKFDKNITKLYRTNADKATQKINLFTDQMIEISIDYLDR